MRVAQRQADGVVGELVDVGHAVAVAIFLFVPQLVHVAAHVDRDRALTERQWTHGLQVDGA